MVDVWNWYDLEQYTSERKWMQGVVVSEHIAWRLTAGAVVLEGLITGSSDYQTIAQTALAQMSKALPAMLRGRSDLGSSPQPIISDS